MADDVIIVEESDSDDKCEVLPKYEQDPRLDFYSEHFDPVLALTVSGVCVPVKNARQYDNLANTRLLWKEREKENKILQEKRIVLRLPWSFKENGYLISVSMTHTE
nr:unnamed protein product [Callosobruchus analis]